MAELLIHSDDVPAAARMALSNAFAKPVDERCNHLFEAALVLHREAGLDCEDARELVGLGASGCDESVAA